MTVVSVLLVNKWIRNQFLQKNQLVAMSFSCKTYKETVDTFNKLALQSIGIMQIYWPIYNKQIMNFIMIGVAKNHISYFIKLNWHDNAFYR